MHLRNGAERRNTDDLRIAFTEHGEVVYTIATYVVGPDVAGDVSAQVFRELWRHPRAVNSETSLRLFLIAAALRTASRAQATGSYEASGQPIRSALERLSAIEREAVLTLRFGQCNYRQAAAALHVEDATFQLHLRRGLTSLRSTLQGVQRGRRRIGVAQV